MPNLISLIESFGYLGIALIIFAESGLFFGFFLPGDSLLFTAGLLASEHFFSISLLIALSCVAAIAGDNAGYIFGKKMGPKIFIRPKSKFFNPAHVHQAKIFFEKHGSQALILARFIPVVRTFTPIIAGVAEMPYRKFSIYNAIGGVLWTTGLLLAGFYLGQTVPNIDKYLLPIILLIIVVSLLPAVFSYFSSKASHK